MKRAKKITLIVSGLLVIGGVIAAAAGIGAGALKSSPDSEYTEVKKEFDAAGIKQLDLSVAADDIVIVPYDGSKLTFTYYTYSPDKQVYTYDTNGGALKITQERPTENHSVKYLFEKIISSFNMDNQYIAATLEVPKNAAYDINVSNSFGAVTVESAEGKLDISSSAGDIAIGNSQAKAVNVQTDYGNISADKLTADSFSCKSSNGELNFDTVTVNGAFNAYTSFGNIYADTVSFKNGTVETEQGEINVNTIKGDMLTIESDFGNITANRLDTNADISTRNGELNLYDSKGKMSLKSDFGNISLSKLTGESLTCHTENGETAVQEVNADIDLSSSYGDIEAHSIFGKGIKLDTDNGAIHASVNGKKSDFKVSATSETGEVNAPNKLDGENAIEAHSSFGDIDISFEE